MKNAGKACNNRLYRHIRTFEKIIKNYFVISIKTVQSAGPMRHPQASFEAQPRIARLLAPKIGIYPYTETGSAYVCAAAFCKNQLHSAGRTESSAPTKQSDIDHDRTFLTR